MKESLSPQKDASKSKVIYNSTYKLLDGFVNNSSTRERDLVESNGWNPRIEEYMIEIQEQSNSYYLMLNEQASEIVIGKWIMLIVSLIISFGMAVVTGVVLGLGEGGIWLPIVTAACLAVISFINGLYEWVGFNDWVSDCRDTGSRFIKLGRKIEAMKRVDSCNRKNGIKVMNKYSSKFEKYRRTAPTVRKKLYLKYFPQSGQDHLTKTQQITVPLKLVEIHQELKDVSQNVTGGDVTIQIDPNYEDTPNVIRKQNESDSTDENYSPEEKGKSDVKSQSSASSSSPKTGASTTTTSSTQETHAERSSQERSNLRKTSSKAPMTLDELFQAELRQNEEKDDMTRYENYFRDQVAKGVVATLMRKKTTLFNNNNKQ